MRKFYFLLIASLFFINGNAQVINFPDVNFKAKLIEANATNNIAKSESGASIAVDANNDGEIEVTEAATVYEILVNESQILSLTGIENFINLKRLECSHNLIVTLDVTALTALEDLICPTNQLTSLNINGLLNLKIINCTDNHLSSLDLSGFVNLNQLACSFNQLTSLDATPCENLTYLDCHKNQLTSINVSGLAHLQYLYCQWNQLTNLDISTTNRLVYLYCHINQLTQLDLSAATWIYEVNAQQNQLVRLYLKNGKSELVDVSSNSNLEYICIDEDNWAHWSVQLQNLGYTNCVLSTYCSFTPGGTYYSITGNQKFDINNDGCDTSDPSVSLLKFNISNSTYSGTVFSNSSGNYNIPVENGTHIITPIIQNATYFNIFPASASIQFPAQPSPFTQNFCITPNGIHNDLEIVIIPVTIARPGFDSTYKIIYKNKGTQTQSGTISYAFDDAVLDFVNANPAVYSQVINYLNWDFTNLQPFETREITLTLNLNSPTEVPPVNNGNILNFIASVNSSLTDETPTDNSFSLNQTVVNSFDPNDKTCLEGNTITPEMVGKEVHYMIRFENTGTTNAENIVVKDMIDTAKFDIASLIPIDGSHPFVTKISNTNKVEFIFENIILPFDDANNDGYVAFKIKTKPTLVLGDSFSNTASIYFDYNFPIITNTATTTVALLANVDFAFEDYFKIYPNPANDILNIESKKTIEVTSINIYNALGQIGLVIPNAQQTHSVDLSSLKTGNYFLKINSDKGTSNVKFIKM